MIPDTDSARGDPVNEFVRRDEEWRECIWSSYSKQDIQIRI